MKKKLLLPIIILLGLFVMHSCAVTTDEDNEDCEKYVGTWSVNDESSRLNYNVTITINPSNSAEILLNNFADLNSTAIGLVVGNSVVIDNQQLNSGNYINNGKMEFSFSLNNGIDIESRVATYTK